MGEELHKLLGFGTRDECCENILLNAGLSVEAVKKALHVGGGEVMIRAVTGAVGLVVSSLGEAVRLLRRAEGITTARNCGPEPVEWFGCGFGCMESQRLSEYRCLLAY